MAGEKAVRKDAWKVVMRALMLVVQTAVQRVGLLAAL